MPSGERLHFAFIDGVSDKFGNQLVGRLTTDGLGCDQGCHAAKAIGPHFVASEGGDHAQMVERGRSAHDIL